MPSRPEIGRTSKREVVFVEVVPLTSTSSPYPYDVIRVCCRYGFGKVAMNVYPGFDVRPLARGADLPCDSYGNFRSFLPQEGWTQTQKDEWGYLLQSGFLDDARKRRKGSLAMKLILEVCKLNGLALKEKTSAS